MTIPFQWPADYLPAIVPPQPPPARARWFLFCSSSILVSTSPPVTLPQLAEPEDLGFTPVRSQYLGELAGEHCFSAEVEPGTDAPQGWSWQNLRMLYGVVDDALFALAGRALQLIDWDRTHQYCGACTSPTRAKMEERGGARERCVEREVQEGVSVRVRNLRYFGSQPWPFPHSLMIAFHAEYDSGEIKIDGVEIEEAQWFDITSLPRLPAKISIARRLIDSALAEMQVLR